MTAAPAGGVRRLGIDVGGTKCLAVVLDGAGAIVAEERRSTPKGPEAIIDTLVELAQACAPFDSVGVGVPGLVTRNGVLTVSYTHLTLPTRGLV